MHRSKIDLKENRKAFKSRVSENPKKVRKLRKVNDLAGKAMDLTRTAMDGQKKTMDRS